MQRATLVLVLLNGLALVLPLSAPAQVISPGKLSAAHGQLEGVRQCTQCHELGQRGIANTRCLACHTALQTRVARRAGYHGTIAKQNCGACHKEHLGREFALVRLDTARFEHDSTGFELKGAHAKVSCRACHTAAGVAASDVKTYHDGAYLERTYLGLPRRCAACHESDSPHGSQFGTRGCESCHDETTWKEAPRFDHARARFTLSGKHRDVKCDGCHSPVANGRVTYTGLAFAACTSCHKDPHAGSMRGACTVCHSTAGWQRIDASAAAGVFDHARTKFPLRGAHARVKCAQCHQPGRNDHIRMRFVPGTEGRTFARPVAETCVSCHRDPHPAAFSAIAAAQSCASCHTEQAWLPARYDAARHNRTGRFVLTGAHTSVPCSSCHARTANGRTTFVLPESSCRACHAGADPHKSKFGNTDCGECHNSSDFREGRFDHKYAAGQQCAACHAARDPHGDQFGGRGCEQCHNTNSFRIERFDHTRTAFPLDGAHSRVACAVCHKPELNAAGQRLVRYRPVPSTCAGCHGGTS